MRKYLLISSALVLILFQNDYCHSYSGITHAGITNNVADDDNGDLQNYLKLVGFSKGRRTEFTLAPSDPPICTPNNTSPNRNSCYFVPFADFNK